jgi:enoyl-CoA hydratase
MRMRCARNRAGSRLSCGDNRMLEITNTDGIAVVTMRHGKANALDVELCEALAAHLPLLASNAQAVVLAGQGRIFSAGVDLVRLSSGGAAYIRHFLPTLDKAFAAVFEFPKPIVAAVNGHAIAGGCVLACAADRRIMAQDAGRIGVTELQVGVPFPPLALEIMRHVTAPHFLEEVILGAGTYKPDEALARGLINDIVAPEALMERAVATARSLAAISPQTYALSKRQLRQGVAERLRQAAPWTAEVTDLWLTDMTAQRVRDYVSRTLKKG